MAYRGTYRGRSYSSGGGLGTAAGAVVVVAVIGFILFRAYAAIQGATANDHWEVCHVNKTSVGYAKDGSSNYRVYTSDCGVLAVRDDLLRGHTNSADIFGQIDAGKTYRFHVVGVRNTFLSYFPDIIGVQPYNGPAPSVSATS